MMRALDTFGSEHQSPWELNEGDHYRNNLSRKCLLSGDEKLPSLDQLLHNSIVNITENPEEVTGDVLKLLEKEYRQALIWGEPNYQSRNVPPLKEHRFAENSFSFEELKVKVDSATVTQCIFDTSALIQKVFNEMEINGEDLFNSELPKKADILTILAHEEKGHDTRKHLPELLVQEIYHAGLDTLF